jgi:hypothetical protein
MPPLPSAFFMFYVLGSVNIYFRAARLYGSHWGVDYGKVFINGLNFKIPIFLSKKMAPGNSFVRI